MSSLRKEVLGIFRKLHHTRKIVFKGDQNALAIARKKINDEFLANKNMVDLKLIEDQIKYAEEVELVLRKAVIQAVRTDVGNYRVVMRKDIELPDTSTPYSPMPENMTGPLKGRKNVPCSEDKKG